jgi:hypothetical protein
VPVNVPVKPAARDAAPLFFFSIIPARRKFLTSTRWDNNPK